MSVEPEKEGPTKSWVAETSCTVRTLDGRTKDVRIRIGRPYQVSENEGACPVEMDGLYPNISDIHGVDTFQALALAVDFVRKIMKNLKDKGATIEDFTGWNLLDLQDLVRNHSVDIAEPD